MNIPGVPRTSDRGHPLRVTTAQQAAARDRAAIAAGVPAFTLMLQAGTQSAAVILRDFADRLADGVVVFAGPGNNGGDAYIVAAQLTRAGVPVRLVVAAPPRTDDARRAADIAARALGTQRAEHRTGRNEQVAVDGLLGTGHRGALRDVIATVAEALAECHARGAMVVALDVPSGMDATTGECARGSVAAQITVTYGTVKRGLLRSRAHAGRVVLLDIGLGAQVALDDSAWCLASASSLADTLPTIAWDAHKRTRGHLALIGGSVGMAGAIVLATRAALASGIGLARAWVEAPGVPALQQGVPQAIANAWGDSTTSPGPWGDALAIGPGLGRTDTSRSVMREALHRHPGAPVVLDADALTLVAGDGDEDAAQRLRHWCGDTRDVVCTPHPGEFARLLGKPVADDWEQRAEDVRDFAVRSGATVLLKGTPTLIATPDGAPIVVMPRGSAVLATGGSGDVLTGIIGTLLAQGAGTASAALLGATAHAWAAERTGQRGIRGCTLDDVLRELPAAWREISHPATFPPGVLAELPAPE
ncbi:MAG: NAD(P)H-hydrate dehydratase [Gemmatimonadaceae bacterium]|nr:NAD(P)H-hydrate dehydratase [Gemmatimonadaceae bacterium]